MITSMYMQLDVAVFSIFTEVRWVFLEWPAQQGFYCAMKKVKTSMNTHCMLHISINMCNVQKLKNMHLLSHLFSHKFFLSVCPFFYSLSSTISIIIDFSTTSFSSLFLSLQFFILSLF